LYKFPEQSQVFEAPGVAAAIDEHNAKGRKIRKNMSMRIFLISSKKLRGTINLLIASVLCITLELFKHLRDNNDPYMLCMMDNSNPLETQLDYIRHFHLHD
jgi:microsomal dipeptidase-like Zn-dependent dipeptidase